MKLKTIAATILLFSAFSPAQAVADECMSLWKERNGIFHDQGYCFDGGLGKGYFGNDGCFTKNPNISSSEKARIAQIQVREGQLGCRAKSKRWTIAALKSADGTTSNPSAEPSTQTAQNAENSIDLPVRIQMEAFLQVLGFNPGQVDGMVDGETIAASQAFQNKYGLPVTAQLDPQNFTVLEALAMASDTPQVQTDEAAQNAGSDEPQTDVAQSETDGNEIIDFSEEVTRPDVTDASSVAMPKLPFDLDLKRLNGHAIIDEFGNSEAHQNTAWQNWLMTNLPRHLPEVSEISPETTLILADLWLTSAEKVRMQSQAGIEAPLFLPESEIPAETTDVQQKVANTSRYLNNLRRHARNTISGLDEFTSPVITDLLRQEVSAKLATYGKPAPLKVAQVFVAGFGEYDFDNKRFELKWGRNSPAQTRFQSLVREAVQKNNADVTWNVDFRELPRYLNVEPAEAQKLVNQVEQLTNNNNRFVYFAVYGQLVSTTGDIKSQIAANRNPKIELKVEVSKTEFALTPDFASPFLTRAHQAVSDADIQAAFEQGKESKTSVFGIKYLRLLMADRLMTPFRSDDATTQMFAEQMVQQSAEFDRFGLDDSAVSNLLREELVSGESHINIDDIAIFRSNFAAAIEHGPAKLMHIPFHVNVRVRDDGSKFVDPGNAKDLLRLALIQNRKQMADLKGNAIGRLGDGGEQRDADKLIASENEGYGGDEIVSLSLIDQSENSVRKYVRLFVAVNKRELATIQNIELPEEIVATANNSFRYATQLTGFDTSDGVLSGHMTLEILDEPQKVAFSRDENTDQQQDSTYVVRAKLNQLTFVNGEKTTVISAGEISNDADGAGAGPTSIGDVAELTTELSDLLTVKYLPNLLSEPDHLRMMFARWHYENAFSDPNSNPDWGRFFDFGAPLPDQSELLSTLNAFKEWTKKRAEILPSHVTITLPFDDYYFGDKNGPTPIRLGTSYINQTMMGRSIDECFRTAEFAAQDASVPKQHRVMLENACQYLKQAAENPGGEIFIANDGYLTTIEADIRQQKTTDLVNSGHSRHGAVGVRATCKQSWRVKEPYCLGMYQELEKGLISKAYFVLDDIYSLDKVVVMTPENISAFEASRGVRKSIRITAAVDEVVRLQQLQMQPPRFRKALLDRFNMLKVAEIEDAMNAPKPFVAIPVNQFQLSAINVEVVDTRNHTTLFVPELQPIVALDETLLQPVAAIYDPAPDAAYGPDIVGLRLGMSFEEADAIIKQHMDVGTALHANRDWSAEEAFGNIKAFSSGRLYESANGEERIVIFDEAPSARGVIMGMTRIVKIEKGKLSEKQVLDGLAAKYGKPSVIDRDTFGWGNIASNCLASARNKSARAVWKDENGEVTDWDIQAFDQQGILLPDNDYIVPNGSRADCELQLVAHFNDYSDQDFDMIIQLLHDKRQYDHHFRQSAEMLKNAPPAVAGEADVDVKF